MTAFTMSVDLVGPPDDEPLPKYSDPGRILFRYVPCQDFFGDAVEIIDYDSDKSPFWLSEGGFMDSTVDDMVSLELEGHYVLEGVTGFYHRGDWSWGEDDYETWSFAYCRRASQAEIAAGALE